MLIEVETIRARRKMEQLYGHDWQNHQNKSMRETSEWKNWRSLEDAYLDELEKVLGCKQEVLRRMSKGDVIDE